MLPASVAASSDAKPRASPSRAFLYAEHAVAALTAVIVLMVPALWNGFPLLQYDSGGYIARWYEGYLVPSRSTTFGLFLTASERFNFWPAVAIQSILTVWVVALALRAFGLAKSPWRTTAVIAVLSVLTTLPWLTSILLTDIFAGLAVLSLHLLVFRPAALRGWEKIGLFLLIAFSAATHSATFAVLLALIGAGFIARIWLPVAVPLHGLVRGLAALAVGAALLLTTNFALSRQFAWTPGGYSIPFGRLLQDGIVTRYLDAHCPQEQLKLCPYRHKLPRTADDFLWGDSIFNELGRFAGLQDEMRHIVLRSLLTNPWDHVRTALAATLSQLTLTATGAGVHDKLWHTYGIIERYLPAMVPAMRAARQQRGALRFDLLNRLHKPVAILSLLLALGLLVRSMYRRDGDKLALLAATVLLAVLANAFVCGALSGPHDRYGARFAWVPVFVVALAALRAWFGAVRPLAGEHPNTATTPRPELPGTTIKQA
jgi:hypothetical protein